MKKSLFSLLAVIVMAGCTQSDVMEPVPNENVEIKLISSAIAAETMTRAPYEGTITAEIRWLHGCWCPKRVAATQRPMPMIKWFLRTTAVRRWALPRQNIIRWTTARCISAACIRLRVGAIRPMMSANLHSMAVRM